MKVDKNNLEDDFFKGLGSANSDAPASNFTHQVMQKIEAQEMAKEQKPLVPKWAWVIITVPFSVAIVLACIYAPMPTEPVLEVSESISPFYSQISQYMGIITLAVAVLFVDTLIRYRKKLNSSQ